MDYKEKYEATLQTARQWIADGCSDTAKIALEAVFPELREGEDKDNDERIRKLILEKMEANRKYSNFYSDEEVAWVEKQKDSIPYEKYVEDIAVINAEAKTKYHAGWNDGYEAKQKEQKPIPLMNGDADLYFDDLRMATQHVLTSREWFEEGIKYAQRLQKQPETASASSIPSCWEEKQQDANEAIEAVERIDTYITEHTANSWEMDDSNPDKKYYCGVDDTLSDIAGILHGIYAKQQEQKPVEQGCKGRRGRRGNIPKDIRKKAEAFLAKMEPPYDADDICTAYETGAIEQKPVKCELEDAFKYYTDAGITVSCGDIVAKPKEQKPADLPAGFYVTFPDGKKYYTKEMRCNNMKVKVVEPKPAEWSKNDTVFLNEITDFFENGTVRLQHDLSMYAHWLKSLPERFVLQPKQEWSEEDEKHINNILDIIDYWKATMHFVSYQGGTIDADITWLKSRRPQPKCLPGFDEMTPEEKMNHPLYLEGFDVGRDVGKVETDWKPSEEQMKALQNAVALTACDKELVKLYNQLKKLMEE